MSIPEVRLGGGPERGEEKKLRWIAGILAVAAGALFLISYLLLGISLFSFAGFLLASIEPRAGAKAVIALVLLASSFIMAGVAVIILGIYSLMAGARARRENPAPIARPATIIYSVVAIMMWSLMLAAGAVLGRVDWRIIQSIIGVTLLLVGAVLVKPGASLARWMAGAALILASVVVVLTGEWLQYATLARELSLGINPSCALRPVVVGAGIAAIVLIIAPFLGRRLLWLTNLIALGGLAATLAVLIASYTPLLADILDKYEMIERLIESLGDIRAALANLFINTTIAGLSTGIAASIIGIVAAILAVFDIIMERVASRSATATQLAQP